jgi:hypothetical protein
MSNIIVAASASGAGTMTVQAPVTSSNRVLTLPDSTGTVMVNGPAFSAARTTSSQSLSRSTWTKVTLNSEEFDTNNCFDLTNSRFTPTVAGYYQFSGAVYLQSGGSGSINFGGFYKNGVLVKYSQGIGLISTDLVLSATALIYLNGTTDYVELYAYNSGTTPTVAGDPNATYFQGVLVRSAT